MIVDDSTHGHQGDLGMQFGELRVRRFAHHALAWMVAGTMASPRSRRLIEPWTGVDGLTSRFN
jgi:hypothetical protein